MKVWDDNGVLTQGYLDSLSESTFALQKQSLKVGAAVLAVNGVSSRGVEGIKAEVRNLVELALRHERLLAQKQKNGELFTGW